MEVEVVKSFSNSNFMISGELFNHIDDISYDTLGVILLLGNHINKDNIIVYDNNVLVSSYEKLRIILKVNDKRWRKIKKELDGLNIIEKVSNNDNIYLQVNKLFINKSLLTNIKDKVAYIYRLYKNNEIIYIGKTKYIVARINQHKKDKDFDKYDYAEINDSEVGMYESYYINIYKPKLNKESKGTLDVNNHLIPLNFV